MSVDEKDLAILYELDKNARQSYKEIGRKLRLNREVVRYRVEKMIRNGIIIRFHTVVNYFKLGIVKYKLYLRLTNISRQKMEEMAEYFKKHKKTEWVVICTGRWDMIIGFLVRNINEFDDEVQNVMNRFSEYIDDKAVTATLYLAHYRREYLTESGVARREVVYYTTKEKKASIDKIDMEILKLITNNARLPTVEIAKILNISPRMVNYRLKKLEREKIILAYKVHVDPKKMGNMFCKAIIYMKNTTRQRVEEFINYCSSLPHAVWPQRVMGSWDFELDFEIESYDKFQDMIFELKEKFPDIIKDYEFIIVRKEFKLDFFPDCYPTFYK